MNDNIITYIFSLTCIILILIETLFSYHKKGVIDMVVFFIYSLPMYYLMTYRGFGGAAFTWWFYLMLFTSFHIVSLLFRIIKYIKRK